MTISIKKTLPLSDDACNNILTYLKVNELCRSIYNNYENNNYFQNIPLNTQNIPPNTQNIPLNTQNIPLNTQNIPPNTQNIIHNY